MPIKKDSYIKRLSQDHHLELIFCERIQLGVDQDVALDRIRAYVSYFWINHLNKHFIEEEDFLFKNLDDVFCTKGKADHVLIESQIDKLMFDKTVGKHDFNYLADSILQHIRFEERVLFPHLELKLSDEELKKVQEALSHSHVSEFADNFPDEFWKLTAE